MSNRNNEHEQREDQEQHMQEGHNEDEDDNENQNFCVYSPTALSTFLDNRGARRTTHMKVEDFSTNIDDEAFAEFHNLEIVDLSEAYNLESIGEDAFRDLEFLSDVYFPPEGRSSLKRIGDGAFMGCLSLTTLDDLPDSIEFIGVSAFRDCLNLTSIRFPSSDYGAICLAYTFKGCTSLQTVHLDGCGPQIGEYAFCDCKSLERIEYTGFSFCFELGSHAFSGCDSLKSFKFYDSPLRICNRAFSYCSSLENVRLAINQEDSQDDEACCYGSCMLVLKEIELYAFENCSSLKNLELPFTLTKVGEGAFCGCTTLDRTIFNSKNIQYFCDVNRGGRLFLQRQHCPRHDKGKDPRMKYPSSLWPLIFHRILHTMEYPSSMACDDRDEDYTPKIDVRRASIIFYLLVEGTVTDLR